MELPRQSAEKNTIRAIYSAKRIKDEYLLKSIDRLCTENSNTGKMSIYIRANDTQAPFFFFTEFLALCFIVLNIFYTSQCIVILA